MQSMVGRCTDTVSQVAVANVVDCVVRNQVESYCRMCKVPYLNFRRSSMRKKLQVVACCMADWHAVEPSHSVAQSVWCVVMNMSREQDFS